MEQSLQIVLSDLQQAIFNETGQHNDVYRQEGKGVICVQAGKPLFPPFVLFAVPDVQIQHAVRKVRANTE